MNKIRTIFLRDERGKVVPAYDPAIEEHMLHHVLVATEKLDGMNVRLTVRNGQMVRIEKRCNPSAQQKMIGIIDPWYTDVDYDNNGDMYLVDAANNTDLSNVPDGEWSGEAIGPKIQGNPLDLKERTVVLFSLYKAPEIKDVPTDYEGLKEWLPKQMSALNPERPIEGIVWNGTSGIMYKIKTRDFPSIKE